jgi:hypothetical protein
MCHLLNYIDLTKCTWDDCPNLLCSVHVKMYGGHCTDCWDTAIIILPPTPLDETQERLMTAIKETVPLTTMGREIVGEASPCHDRKSAKGTLKVSNGSAAQTS